MVRHIRRRKKNVVFPVTPPNFLESVGRKTFFFFLSFFSNVSAEICEKFHFHIVVTIFLFFSFSQIFCVI